VLAAYRRLADDGFEGLRTRGIADDVGVNVATLHYHFPTKEAVVRGVVGHALGRFRSTLPTSGTARDQLRAHFRGLRRLSRREPELFSVMGELALRGRRDRGVAAILRRTDEFWHYTLRDLLRRGSRDRTVDLPGNADDVCGLIIVALKGTYMLPAASRKAQLLDRTLDQLERWLGIAGRPRSSGRRRFPTGPGARRPDRRGAPASRSGAAGRARGGAR
jgi:AcrR family transcriptional regulator